MPDCLNAERNPKLRLCILILLRRLVLPISTHYKWGTRRSLLLTAGFAIKGPALRRVGLEWYLIISAQ